MSSKYSPSSDSHSVGEKKKESKQGSVLTSDQVICLKGKQKQGESDVPGPGRELGQMDKTFGLLFRYFI